MDNTKLKKELNRLTDEDNFGDIVQLIEKIPENERDWETIGWYVRALNNSEQAPRAIEVSLRYQEQGENDPLWHYRLGYAYWYLDRYDEAEPVLRRAKELATNNVQITEWVDELLRYLDEDTDEENQEYIQSDEEQDTANFAATVKHKNTISVCFYIEQDKIITIGEKMNEINDDAYMNGYNWEAFFNYYLPKYAPDVCENMKTDPEAGMYVAYYDLTPENEARAEKFVEIIKYLVEHEEELYCIVREDGENIAWD